MTFIGDEIDCATALEWLDELGEDAFRATDGAMAKHIAGCHECAGAWMTARRIRRVLRHAGPVAAPAELREKIGASLHSQPLRARPPARAWAAAAAASLALAGGTAVFLGTLATSEPFSGPRATTAREQSEVQIARTGLDHHRHCSHALPPPAVPRSDDDLVSRIGSEYVPLLDAVRSRMPGQMKVVDAHVCASSGVRYTHVVTRGDGRLASVLVSRVDEGATGGGATVDAGDGSTTARSWSSGEHQVWVVSDDADYTAGRIALAIEPAVRIALDRHA